VLGGKWPTPGLLEQRNEEGSTPLSELAAQRPNTYSNPVGATTPKFLECLPQSLLKDRSFPGAARCPERFVDFLLQAKRARR
jgi:hypothetical protein